MNGVVWGRPGARRKGDLSSRWRGDLPPPGDAAIKGFCIRGAAHLGTL